MCIVYVLEMRVQVTRLSGKVWQVGELGNFKLVQKWPLIKDQVEYLMIKSNRIFLSSLYLQFIDTLGSKYMLMVQDTILE